MKGDMSFYNVLLRWA